MLAGGHCVSADEVVVAASAGGEGQAKASARGWVTGESLGGRVHTDSAGAGSRALVALALAGCAGSGVASVWAVCCGTGWSADWSQGWATLDCIAPDCTGPVWTAAVWGAAVWGTAEAALGLVVSVPTAPGCAVPDWGVPGWDASS
ncbi:hypothetical protein LV78_000019 [Actinosynnema pretiosum]|nr:hypothetical protein [Actinosynnema pretiosum]